MVLDRRGNWRQSEATAFQIFDQNTLHLLEPRYSTAIPVTDNTIEGLAHKLGVNVNIFLETVREFNAATRPGTFDPFRLDGLSTYLSFMIPKPN
jgi:tricarballylate dehydrogenase